MIKQAFLAAAALACLPAGSVIAQVSFSAPTAVSDPRLARWGALGKMVGKKFGHPDVPTEWFLVKDNMIVSRVFAGQELRQAYIYKGPGKAEYSQLLSDGKLGSRSKVTFDDNSWTIKGTRRNQRFWLTPEGHLWKEVYGDLEADELGEPRPDQALIGAPGWEQFAKASMNAYTKVNQYALANHERARAEERAEDNARRQAINSASAAIMSQTIANMSAAAGNLGRRPVQNGSSGTYGSGSGGSGDGAASSFRGEQQDPHHSCGFHKDGTGKFVRNDCDRELVFFHSKDGQRGSVRLAPTQEASFPAGTTFWGACRVGWTLENPGGGVTNCVAGPGATAYEVKHLPSGPVR